MFASCVDLPTYIFNYVNVVLVFEVVVVVVVVVVVFVVVVVVVLVVIVVVGVEFDIFFFSPPFCFSSTSLLYKYVHMCACMFVYKHVCVINIRR